MSAVRITAITPMIRDEPEYAVATAEIRLKKPHLDGADKLEVRVVFRYDENSSVAEIKQQALEEVKATLETARAACDEGLSDTLITLD